MRPFRIRAAGIGEWLVRLADRHRSPQTEPNRPGDRLGDEQIFWESRQKVGTGLEAFSWMARPAPDHQTNSPTECEITLNRSLEFSFNRRPSLYCYLTGGPIGRSLIGPVE